MDIEMVRQLCFVAVAMLFSGSVCNAEFVIDDFTGSGGAASVANFNFLAGQGYRAGTEVLTNFNFGAGDTAQLVYNLAPGALAGTSGLNFDFTLSSPPNAISLNLTGSNAGDVIFSETTTLDPGGSPASVNIGAALANATSLTLDFQNVSTANATFSFGSSSGTFSAVPEPTALLLFPTAIGLVMANRRRRSR